MPDIYIIYDNRGLTLFDLRCTLHLPNLKYMVDALIYLLVDSGIALYIGVAGVLVGLILLTDLLNK